MSVLYTLKCNINCGITESRPPPICPLIPNLTQEIPLELSRYFWPAKPKLYVKEISTLGFRVF